MFSENNKISVRQIQALIITYFLGVNATILPRIASEYVGHNAWLAVAVSAVLAGAGAYLCVTSVMLYRGKVSLHDILCFAFSSFVGKIACVVLTAYFTLLAALKLRIFGEIVAAYLLPQTPLWQVAALMLFLAFFASFHGVETKSRASEILVFIVVVPLIILIFFGIFSADFSNLLPITQVSGSDILIGGFESGFVFTGLPFLLVIVPMLAVGGAISRRRILGSFAFLSALLIVVTMLCVSVLGVSSVLNSRHPFLELLFVINIPGSFMERQNALVLSFLILTVFITITVLTCCGTVLLRDTFATGKRRNYCYILLAAIFTVTLLISTENQAIEFMQTIYRYTTPIFVFALPVLLILAARFKSKKLRHEE
ncbi:MAG: endospore germination permease [Defluviitaleaceae bacterium]|nr:endospore germination permease [Defluviitaleaceae bacterium]